MPRLFIGIPVPDSYHEKMASMTDALSSRLKSKVKWTKSDNAHITLRFLGDTDEAEMEAILRALRAIDAPAFYMRAGGGGCFPDDRRPRVLWAGIMKGAKACADLAATINMTLETVGVKTDQRPFKCHLTLGRVKWLENDDMARRIREESGVWPGFKVDRFTLWQSTLTPDGSIYEVVEEFPLRDEGNV